MSFGLGTAAARTNKQQAAGGGGIITANNGLTTAGAVAQLGQNVGAVGNPAILLNDREIPMAGFSFIMNSAGNNQFIVDPDAATPHYGLGDIDQVNKKGYLDIAGHNVILACGDGGVVIGDRDSYGHSTILTISDASRLIAAGINGNHYLEIDVPADTYQFGDVNSNTSGMIAYIDNRPLVRDIVIGDRTSNNNGTQFNLNDATELIQISSIHATALRLDIPNMDYWLGDFNFAQTNPAVIGVSGFAGGAGPGYTVEVNSTAHNNKLQIFTQGLNNSVAPRLSHKLVINGVDTSYEMREGQFVFGDTGRMLVLTRSTGLYEMGDIDAGGNGTYFSINDTTKELFANFGATPLIYATTGASSQVAIGDLNGVLPTGASFFVNQTAGGAVNAYGTIGGSSFSTMLSLLPSIGTYRMGDIDNANNNGFIRIDDVNNFFDYLSNNSRYLFLDAANFVFSIGDVDNSNHGTLLKIDDAAQLFTLTNVPAFANNAAAVGAGLTVGQLYRSGDNLNIVH